MAFQLFDNVMESSTTTGTGDFTLAGAITGFSTFSSRYSTGDTCYYAIKDVDAAGGPSGAWEVGIGTYSAANTLTRTTVLSSSNSDALVNFAAGTKRVFVTLTALQGNSIREKLTAARTYYVRTDGSDSNNGLANTSGGAFLTVQKAVDVVYQMLDLAIYNVTIQVADGTYSGPVVCSGPLIGSGTLTIKGNVSTPTNVIFSTGANTCIVSKLGAAVNVESLKISNTSGYGIQATQKGHINYQGIDFGAVALSQVRADDCGTISCTGNYTISGGSVDHFNAVTGGILRCFSKTITLSGTPAYTNFSLCGYCGVQIVHGNTFSGTGATGARYSVILNGVISTNGGGANYFPGNSAGTTATGGQYA